MDEFIQATEPDVLKLREIWKERIVIPPFTPHQIIGGTVGGQLLEISTTHRDEDSFRFKGPDGSSTAQGSQEQASDPGSIPGGSTIDPESFRCSVCGVPLKTIVERGIADCNGLHDGHAWVNEIARL